MKSRLVLVLGKLTTDILNDTELSTKLSLAPQKHSASRQFVFIEIKSHLLCIANLLFSVTSSSWWYHLLLTLYRYWRLISDYIALLALRSFSPQTDNWSNLLEVSLSIAGLWWGMWQDGGGGSSSPTDQKPSRPVGQYGSGWSELKTLNKQEATLGSREQRNRK